MKWRERKDGEGGVRVEDGQGGGGGGSGAGFCHYSLCLVSLTLSLSVSLVKLFLVSQIPCFFYCVDFDLVRFAVCYGVVREYIAHTQNDSRLSRWRELRWTDGRMDREGGMAFCVALLAFGQGMDGGHSKVWPGEGWGGETGGGKGEMVSGDKIWEGRPGGHSGDKVQRGSGFFLFCLAFFFLCLCFAEH